MGGSVNLTHGHIDYDEQKTKIKAIYPHIVVSGDIDKPYYSIHWYDIEQETMICGYSSYKLSLVRKWLKECFEVVDDDIDNLINKLKKSNKNYEQLQKELLKTNSQLYSELELKRKIIKAGNDLIISLQAENERLQQEPKEAPSAKIDFFYSRFMKKE